jgi:hypothetical protein
MRKFTKTTLVAALMTSATFGVMAKDGETDRVARIEQEAGSKYTLTYLTSGACNVKVRILDESGQAVFVDKIRNAKSFTKPYNLANLAEGEYTFEVQDSEGVITKTVSRAAQSSQLPKALISKTENARYEVKVIGQELAPVIINIYDQNGNQIFGDYVDLNKSFKKVYDLSKVEEDKIRFEISSDMGVLATSTF